MWIFFCGDLLMWINEATTWYCPYWRCPYKFTWPVHLDIFSEVKFMCCHWKKSSFFHNHWKRSSNARMLLRCWSKQIQRSQVWFFFLKCQTHDNNTPTHRDVCFHSHHWDTSNTTVMIISNVFSNILYK